jgi:hypothetical protein
MSLGKALVGFVGLVALAGCGSDAAGGAGKPGGSSGGQSGIASIDDAVAQDLQFVREEEKLARDVYLKLYDRWQLMQHKNIATSEQTHMDRVADTLAAFNVEDPVQSGAAIGAFKNATLGKLYTDLTTAGNESEVAALRVGVTIEDLDIRDIEAMTDRTDNIAILSMYSALQCGSRNHLRAFTSQLALRGETYTPQYLGATDFDAILAAPKEKCGP